MARTKKTLYYFPVDTDLYQDIKVRKLIKAKGGAAVAVFINLLCQIYKEGYYMKMDPDTPFLVSEACGMTEDYVRDVIAFCVNIELFDGGMLEACDILTSRGIQERYYSICKLTRRKNDVVEFCLISDLVPYTRQPRKPRAKKAKAAEQETKQPKFSSSNKALCKKFKLTDEQVNQYKEQFLTDCECKGVTHKDKRDLLSHFTDWLSKQLDAHRKEMEKQSSAQQQGPPEKTDVQIEQEQKDAEYQKWCRDNGMNPNDTSAGQQFFEQVLLKKKK